MMMTTESSRNERKCPNESSPELQTRFSFYNADEFIVKTPELFVAPPTSEATMTHNKTAAAAAATIQLSPVQEDDDTANILKSLQDHEQQRLHILETCVEAAEDHSAGGVLPPSSSSSTNHNNNSEVDHRRMERNQRLQKYAQLVKGLKQEQDDDDDDDDKEEDQLRIIPSLSGVSQRPKINSDFTFSEEDQTDEDDIVRQPIPPDQDVLLGGPEAFPHGVLSYEAIAASKDLDTFDDEEGDELDGLVQRASNLTLSATTTPNSTTKSQTNRRFPEVIRSDDEDDGDPEDDDEDDFDKEMDDEDSTSHTDIEAKESRRVLGPLSQRYETGVVLEYDDDDEEEESTDSSYSTQEDRNNPILDTLSAAVSFVTGAKHSSEQTDDDYVDDDEEETESVEDVFDNPPDWDNDDPDELGYRIVRISQDQLEQLEADFDEESDAQHDEIAKDLAELQAKRAVTVSPQRVLGGDAGQTLESFPGVRPAGHGEMGDLEYFSLPIIFKSHVTGFEPTKDWILEPGNVVAGQYLVEGVLGSAAFSTAYKCIDLNSNSSSYSNNKEQTHEEVCLKVIKNTKDFFDQSLDEIKILELLRQTGQCHENFIVEMKTFFYHREHLIIVTELLRQNLFEFGKFISESGEEPYFTIPRLAYVARQCLIALKFVHSLGLVHSDVKPENILLASYSRAIVKLIDFGSSCYVTDRQSSYIQSRSYRAPEVCLGLPYDGRIDVWSLGCVIAEMFTGEVTFQNDSVVSMLSRMEAICGKFPRHMIVQGRQSSQFFTKSGFLYEETSTKDVIDIYQAKRTTLSQRLGFSVDLLRRFDRSSKLSRSEQQQALFCDFCRQLLTIDPVLRPTAAELLDHPLMQFAATLTEADVIYPSSS